MRNNSIKLKDVRMLQCVFGTSVCNLSCGYCGWPKKAEKIDMADTLRSERTMDEIFDFCSINLPNCKTFAVTGGEPLLFKAAIERMLDRFNGFHLKISTNAILLNDEYLDAFCRHGNTSLCISLDGCDFASNKTRYPNERIFNLVVGNIEKALERGLFVEISCVINKNNIDNMRNFCKWIERRWKKYLDRLLLIAYPITTYTQKGGPELEFFFNKVQRRHLVDFLKKEIDNFTVLKNVKQYYLDLIDYLNGDLHKKEKCKKYSWCLTTEYVGSSFWRSGNFISFGCGTKGDKGLGMFNFSNKEDADLLAERKKSKCLIKYFDDLHGDCESKCFTNWHMIDLFYKGEFKKTHPLGSMIYKNG